jgi:nitrogen fixation-related uncharacterized protein
MVALLIWLVAAVLVAFAWGALVDSGGSDDDDEEQP